ncbi:MAG: hypothetical protein GYB53_12135 [Rhodobacteraceae bacterium]|nr:hypothetical protein [Paracoccaceae bacterium]MBR9823212.1 hypothetical protein [Paracoccaceae bacterium]
MTRPTLALPILALIAVTAVTAASAMSRPPEATPCGAELHGDMIGQTWTDAMLPERDDPVRVLHPESMATMDHRPERLNIHVSEDGTVTQLRCG